MNWCVFFYARCQFLIGLRNTSCVLIWNSWNIIYFLHIDILYYCCTITLNWGSNTTKSRQHNYKWNQLFRAYLEVIILIVLIIEKWKEEIGSQSWFMTRGLSVPFFSNFGRICSSPCDFQILIIEKEAYKEREAKKRHEWTNIFM